MNVHSVNWSGQFLTELFERFRSIWKELEASTDRARARTAARLRRAGTDSDRLVRALRVRINLTDCKGA